MYLTLSKRFEFSASHFCRVEGWSAEDNAATFGNEGRGPFGHGHNFELFVVFHGDVDPDDGMVINVTDIKKGVNEILKTGYDHKFLNVDNRAFAQAVPSVERVAAQLLTDIQETFKGARARPVACHVVADRNLAATAFENGTVERVAEATFHSIVRWGSPHLTELENIALFGDAAREAGVGRRFELHVTLRGTPDETSGVIVKDADLDGVNRTLVDTLNNRQLHHDLEGLYGQAVTPETLTRWLYTKLSEDLPVHRIRLSGEPGVDIAYSPSEGFGLSFIHRFHSAHRLHSPALSDDANLQVYGKCNSPGGHGHNYVLETACSGAIDEESGCIVPVAKSRERIESVLSEWDYRHLDRELDGFQDRPSTAENMIYRLWSQLEESCDFNLSRLRLWETSNNRFTLRRSVD
jgi:6-pyruvoyltetrahydropterin/6-carboxytetrahydropterin synthase